MGMLMIIYTMTVYPGIIGGIESGSLSILEGIIELVIAIAIQIIIWKAWTYLSSRKNRTIEGAGH